MSEVWKNVNKNNSKVSKFWSRITCSCLLKADCFTQVWIPIEKIRLIQKRKEVNLNYLNFMRILFVFKNLDKTWSKSIVLLQNRLMESLCEQLPPVMPFDLLITTGMDGPPAWLSSLVPTLVSALALWFPHPDWLCSLLSGLYFSARHTLNEKSEFVCESNTECLGSYHFCLFPADS